MVLIGGASSVVWTVPSTYRRKAPPLRLEQLGEHPGGHGGPVGLDRPVAHLPIDRGPVTTMGRDHLRHVHLTLGIRSRAALADVIDG
jgi:hypothetical protein